MSKIVGIDLGTTNSLVAVVDSGIPYVLADADGQRLTPSVVYFPSAAGQPTVGRMASGLVALKKVLLRGRRRSRRNQRHRHEARLRWSVGLVLLAAVLCLSAVGASSPPATAPEPAMTTPPQREYQSYRLTWRSDPTEWHIDGGRLLNLDFGRTTLEEIAERYRPWWPGVTPGRTPKMADTHWRDLVAKLFEATPNYWYDGMIDGDEIRHYHVQRQAETSVVHQQWCGFLGAWAVGCCWTELGGDAGPVQRQM
jgi:hypothetical protein